MSQPLPYSFISRKKRILQALAVPSEQYDDLSPKGSIDQGIRQLIDEINALDGYVTTSSCSGRVSVFLEGKRVDSRNESGDRTQNKAAGFGGKGGGGRWLFVSHDPVHINESSDSWTTTLGMEAMNIKEAELMIGRGATESARLIHFKFEPMILHILTASPQQADTLLSAALQAGFRESGALNLIGQHVTPMVGIRTMGLALESIIGFERDGREICMVPEWQLQNLLRIANRRFGENTKRIERFRVGLREMILAGQGKAGMEKRGDDGDIWEDSKLRRERKRREGLKKATALMEATVTEKDGAPEIEPFYS